MNSSPSTTSQWIGRFALVLCVGLPCALMAYLWGYSSRHEVESRSFDGSTARVHSLFAVQGRSMAPTLVNGDVCEVDTQADQFQIGDLLIVTWDGKQHLKRIAALGGDVVDVDRGRLTVNSVRVEDLIAERSGEWFTPPKEVPVPARREQWIREQPPEDGGQDEWLIYHHKNSHAGGRATAVMDDYPDNTDVRRTLHPVERLVANVDSIVGTQSREFDVAFWRDGEVCFARTVGGKATTRGAEKVAGLFMKVPPLGESSPIAVRISSAEEGSFDIKVARQIEYRVDERSDQLQYPVKLSGNQFFLVGDNVPVSVDSRTIGPVSRQQIVGKVIGKAFHSGDSLKPQADESQGL